MSERRTRYKVEVKTNGHWSSEMSLADWWTMRENAIAMGRLAERMLIAAGEMHEERRMFYSREELRRDNNNR